MAGTMSGTEQLRATASAEADGTGTLTAALSRGDEPAWIAFHAAYEVRLKSYIRTCLGGAGGDVDDLFQETMLRVARHAKRFDSGPAFWCWLTVLARSALADNGRKRSAWARFLDRYRRLHEFDPRRIPPSRLDDALARLGDDDRKLIEEKYEDRTSVRALAQRLGVTERVVEHRLAKARQRLAKYLRRLEKEDS